MFSLLVLTGMTDSFSLRLRLEFSPLQRFINLCVTMGHLSYTVSKDCVKKLKYFFYNELIDQNHQHKYEENLSTDTKIESKQ